MDSVSTPSTRLPPGSAWHALAQQYLSVRHTRHQAADVETVLPAGEIDLFTISLLQDVLRETEQRQLPRVLVDLSATTFLAVIGVHTLLAAADHAAATNREFALVVTTRPIRRVLQTTGACDRLASYAGVSEALAGLASPPTPEPER